MPLKIKCTGCGRILLLDDAFAGAYCRCRHCRRLLDVPTRLFGAGASAQARLRPLHPPAGQARSHGAGHSGERRRKPVARSRPRQLMLAGASLSVIALASVWLVSWYQQMQSDRASLTREQLVTAISDRNARRTTDAATAKAALPADAWAGRLREFFSVPLDRPSAAFVVDGDRSMAPYLDSVAFLTSSAVEAMDPAFLAPTRGNASEGDGSASPPQAAVLLATAGSPLAFSPARADAKCFQAVQSLLLSRLPAGASDLSAAIAQAATWRPDLLFIVLAKPLGAAEMETFRQRVEQSGATTHVVALGPAASDAFLAVADATGGSYLSFTEEQLKQTVDDRRQQLAVARFEFRKESSDTPTTP